MIKSLFRSYWDICLFRKSPEQTVYSPFLMVLSGFLFAALIMLQWQITDSKDTLDFDISLYRGVTLILSYAAFTGLLLFLFNVNDRFVKTLTSLFCCHFIVHIIALPVLLMMPALADANMKNPVMVSLGMIYLLVTLALSIWQILISAQIYRFSLEVSSIKSILASVGLIATNLLTISFWQ